MFGELPVDLNRLTRILANRWVDFNKDVFKGALLHAPSILIKDISSKLGEWDPELRQIMISQTCALTKPWNVVLEVFKHEMAHQYVSDVLKISGGDETSHGPAFRRTCKQFAIDHHAAHKPSEAEKKTIERVSKLLNLANSSNEHEAQAALTAAHRLLGRSGLTEEDVRPVGDNSEIGIIHLGPVIGRIESHHSWIASMLSRFFHVQCIWVRVHDPRIDKKGVQLEICGRSSDLALAEYVHGFLHATADRLCPKKLAHHARLSWKSSFAQGFFSNLKEEESTMKRTIATEQPGLVLVTGVDKEVTQYFHTRYPRISNLSGGGGRRFDKDGWSAGKDTRLQQPLQGGPKLLSAKT